MKELSLNILDIAQNSIKAKASIIYIELVEDETTLSITISDDGCGISPEMVKNVTNPFCTTRTTRKVGLGIPFLKLSAEQTGGHISIQSKSIDEFPDSHGTTTFALFYKNHLDFAPLGDIISTVCTLIQGMQNIDLVFTHKADMLDVNLDTRVLRETLGDIPLSTPDVLVWINEFLKEQYNKS